MSASAAQPIPIAAPPPVENIANAGIDVSAIHPQSVVGSLSDDSIQSPTFKSGHFGEDKGVKSPPVGTSMDDLYSGGGSYSAGKAKITSAKHMLSPRLLELVIYCKTKQFRGFLHALGKN